QRHSLRARFILLGRLVIVVVTCLHENSVLVIWRRRSIAMTLGTGCAAIIMVVVVSLLLPLVAGRRSLGTRSRGHNNHHRMLRFKVIIVVNGLDAAVLMFQRHGSKVQVIIFVGVLILGRASSLFPEGESRLCVCAFAAPACHDVNPSLSG